jgi:hypothetical protein
MKVIEFKVLTKIIKMIDSTQNSIQGLATRNYIDLYYRQFGTSKKEYIETVFRNKIKSFYTL